MNTTTLSSPAERRAASTDNLQRWYRTLIKVALFITFDIIVLGAFVRLMDAGLGCPDWPGCYGHVGVPHSADAVAKAQAVYGQEVEHTKAWLEMIHRYLAAGLGLIAIAMVVIAWRLRRVQSPWFACLMLAVIILQGMFGKWTVTLKLMPAVVTTHLLGGITILALFTWAYLRIRPQRAIKGTVSRTTLLLATGGLVALFLQIAAGGWVSSNYAALACPDLPLCRGQWVPSNMEFHEGFRLDRELGLAPDGELLPIEALVAIHWVHRLGAVIVTLILGWLVFHLFRHVRAPGLAWMLAATLVLQLVIGLSNIIWSLPLWLATLHNAGAAALVVVLVTINARLRGVGSSSHE